MSDAAANAAGEAAKVVKDSSGTTFMVILIVLLLIGGIGVRYFSRGFHVHCAISDFKPSFCCTQAYVYKVNNDIEYIERKKLGVKKAKRLAEEERKKKAGQRLVQ